MSSRNNEKFFSQSLDAGAPTIGSVAFIPKWSNLSQSDPDGGLSRIVNTPITNEFVIVVGRPWRHCFYHSAYGHYCYDYCLPVLRSGTLIELVWTTSVNVRACDEMPDWFSMMNFKGPTNDLSDSDYLSENLQLGSESILPKSL